MRALLNSLLYAPSRTLLATPADAGLSFRDLSIRSADGESLHGWLIAGTPPSLGHILFCHGNGGNVGDRVDHAGALASAGFDVLLFDYRGYGKSSGRPHEEGTYADARAARQTLLDQEGVDESRTFFLGESLGGAVALMLALEAPPRGLILQSTFTSVRDVARVHYPFLPRFAIPDAYPSLSRMSELDAPLLLLHGEADEVVPAAQGRALFEVARHPKEIRMVPHAAHSDLVALAGEDYAETIAAFSRRLDDA